MILLTSQKKTDEELRKINYKITSNKTRHAETEKKLNDCVTYHTKLINDLLGEVKLISKKALTKTWYMDVVFLILQNILSKMDHKII